MRCEDSAAVVLSLAAHGTASDCLGTCLAFLLLFSFLADDRGLPSEQTSSMVTFGKVDVGSTLVLSVEADVAGTVTFRGTAPDVLFKPPTVIL